MARLNLDKYTKIFAQREKMFFLAKVAVFVLLVLLEFVLVYNVFDEYGFSIPFWSVFGVSLVMIVENAVKTFAIREFRHKITCYIIDFIGLLILALVTSTNLVATLCMVVLSEFYLSSYNTKSNFIMLFTWISLYSAIMITSVILFHKEFDATFYTDIMNDFIVFMIHFAIMTLSVRLYQKNDEFAKVIDDLDKANANLQEAYEKIAETTAIEERQKIAKDIHDTAGHSITTVIMQTEAAKLCIEKDPVEAKKKIIAANLQAKNALEELRTSVHLLSGRMNGKTMKELFERIILDTSNGTDIAIRSQIEDIEIEEEKAVFLCNTLKEGFSNGMRHGGATAFWVELKQEDYAVTFILSDNGVGLDLANLKEGFGLTGMKRRAEALGGIARFSSQVDEGFEITITLPIKRKEDTHE